MISFVIKLIDRYYHRKRIYNFFKNKKIVNFIDVGGHEGDYSQMFLNNSIKCIIFEPQEKYRRKLKKKFISNKNIKILPYAIGDKSEKKYLKIGFLESTSTLANINENSKWFKLKKAIYFNKVYKNKYLVNVKTLDSINYIKKLDQISILKIDTEGYDLKVLQGAKNILNKTKFVIVECHKNNMYKNYNGNDISNYLKLKKFKSLIKFKFPFINFYDEIYMNLNKIKD